jgi:PKD repeat protein
MKKIITFLIFCLLPYIAFSQADFGDAPDNGTDWWGGTSHFPTLDANTGPKHIQGDVSTFWLGNIGTSGNNTTTMEADAKVIDNDEDDGQPFIFILLVGIPAPSNITVPISTSPSHNPATDIYVNVVIDVDNDLDFDDNPDQNWVVQNKVVHCLADTTLGFDFGPFGFGSDLLLLPVWARITLTTEPVNSPWNGAGKPGGWTYGETEDWWYGPSVGRGRNARKGGGPVPPGGGGIGGGGGGGGGKSITLVYPHTVYVKCDETKCFWLGVKSTGSTPATNISVSFNFSAGTPLQSGPSVVGDPVAIGNTTWFLICVTGWPCEGGEELRWAKYTIKVKYDPDGLYVTKSFEMEFGNDEYPMALDDQSQYVNHVAAEPLDSTDFSPWYVTQGEQITKQLVAWAGQYPGGIPWLNNGQPQLTVVKMPVWAQFNETDRSGDNNSATYTFTGTPANNHNGLDYLSVAVESSDPTDGFQPWIWDIPIYIINNNHPPEVERNFATNYSVNVFQDEFIMTSFSASDDDIRLGKQDTLFFDWYLWDTDSSRFFDDPSLTFTIAPDSAFLHWVPTMDDIGNYDMVGLVWDYYSGMDSSESEVNIFYLKPDFNSAYPVGFAPHTMQFTDNSDAINTEVVEWDWTFNDGGSSTQQNPIHTYNESGSYTVALSINNLTHTISDYKYNYVVVNELDFEAGATEGLAPFEVEFTNLSTTELPELYTSNTMTSATFGWNWDFGDGESSTEKNPVHVYDSPGYYTVELQGLIFIYENGELIDSVVSEILSKEDYIYVQGDLVADFEANVLDGYAPLSVTFTDQTTGQPTGWLWSFGDGSDNDTTQNPVHVYENPGLYNVSLTVSKDELQNTMEKQEYINVRQPLVAQFSATPTSGAAPLSVAFTDESLGDPPPETWYWDFGDGATSLEQNPSHEYMDEGTYDVMLIVDNGEMKDTLTETEYIVVTDADFVADFTAEPLKGEEPLTVQFTDLSIGQPTQWLWNFGPESATSTQKNPQYTYNNSGTYTVSLWISDGIQQDETTKEDYIEVGGTGIYDFMQKGFTLFQNYPNPMKQSTTIGFELKYTSTISLKLYNMLGEEVKTFIYQEYKVPGEYVLTWDGRDNTGKQVSAGAYYYELTIEGSEYKFNKTKELVIIR